MSITTYHIVQWDPNVSVLLWLERRRPTQSERHAKSNLRGEFFQVVEVVQKQRYFKFVISASHCQQLGLYSSVIQFVILHYIKVIKSVLK